MVKVKSEVQASSQRGEASARGQPKALGDPCGTTQSAISRIENDQLSPTIETLRGLLHMLGEDLVMDAVERDAGIDRGMTRAKVASQNARYRRAMEFSDFVRDHLTDEAKVA